MASIDACDRIGSFDADIYIVFFYQNEFLIAVFGVDAAHPCGDGLNSLGGFSERYKAGRYARANSVSPRTTSVHD